jgi:hypothetical protein
MANSNLLRFWRAAKNCLPFVITGARSNDTGDDNPVGAIYNAFFVRLPALIAGFIYSKNLMDGKPLVVDFGEGPLTLPPLIVLGVLCLLLQ